MADIPAALKLADSIPPTAEAITDTRPTKIYKRHPALYGAGCLCSQGVSRSFI